MRKFYYGSVAFFELVAVIFTIVIFAVNYNEIKFNVFVIFGLISIPLFIKAVIDNVKKAKSDVDLVDELCNNVSLSKGYYVAMVIFKGILFMLTAIYIAEYFYKFALNDMLFLSLILMPLSYEECFKGIVIVKNYKNRKFATK